MSLLTIVYAALFYLATVILVVGVALKIRTYARAPAPLKIPTTPAPLTKSGVGWRMAREVVFLKVYSNLVCGLGFLDGLFMRHYWL